MAYSAVHVTESSSLCLGHTGGLNAGAQVSRCNDEGAGMFAGSEEFVVAGKARDVGAGQATFVLKEPAEVLSGMLDRGVSTADAMRLVMEYYRVAEVVHGSAVGASDLSYDTGGLSSTCSAATGSTSRSRRTDNWRRAARALAERPGYCYLRVVRFSRRKRISLLLGANPDVSKLVSALRSDDVDMSAMSSMWVFSVPALDNSTRHWYHVGDACEQGEKVAVARDFFSAYSKKYPYLCDNGFSIDGLEQPLAVLPLVGKIGILSSLFSRPPVPVVQEDVDCYSSLDRLHDLLDSYSVRANEFPGNWLVVNLTGHGDPVQNRSPLSLGRVDMASAAFHDDLGNYQVGPVVPRGSVYALVLGRAHPVTVEGITYGTRDTVVVLLLGGGRTALEFTIFYDMRCAVVDITCMRLAAVALGRSARRVCSASVMHLPDIAYSSLASAEVLCSDEPGPGVYSIAGLYTPATLYVVSRAGSVWYSRVDAFPSNLDMVIGGVIRLRFPSGDIECPAGVPFCFDTEFSARRPLSGNWQFEYEHSRR